jgi:hypothetical protein
MGSDKTPLYMRGLLIPDPRFTFEGAFSETGSTYSELTPRAGVPAALDNSDLIVETSGTQDANSNYTIYTQNSGYPENLGGTFLHRNTAETSDLSYFGWEPPHTISGLERVHGEDSKNFRNFDTVTAQDDTVIIAAIAHEDPVLKVFSKGPDAVAWSTHTVDIETEPGMVIAFGQRPTDASTGSDFEAGCNPSPALVVLPSGRVLLFAWLQTAEEITASPKSIKSWQITAWYSDDSGAAWKPYQEYCLQTPLRQTYDDPDDTYGRFYPGRLRGEYKDGQILLISSGYDTGDSTHNGAPAYPGNVYFQYASSSLGASFQEVELSDRGDNLAAFDVAVSGGYFVLSYLKAGYVRVRRLGSAYTPFSYSTDDYQIEGAYGSGFGEGLSAVPNGLGRVDQTICAAPGGSMYICSTRHGTPVGSVHTRHSVAMFSSGDSGLTWTPTGNDWGSKAAPGTGTSNYKDGIVYSSRFWDEPAPTADKQRDTLFDLSMTWQRGRVVLACRFEKTNASSSTVYDEGVKDRNVSALYLGGYTNLTIGSSAAASSMADRGSFARHWYPFVKPDEMYGAWSVTSSGTVSSALGLTSQLPYLTLTTGNGSGIGGFYYFTTTGDELNHTDTRTTETSAAHMRTYFEFACALQTGGSAANAEVAVKIRNGNPTKGTKCSLRLWSSGGIHQLSIYDEIPGTPALIGTFALSTLSAGAIPEFRVEIVDQRIAIYYRAYAPSTELKTWTKGYESASSEFTYGAVTGKYCQIDWGHLINGGSSTVNKSRWYKLQIGSHDGDLNHCAVPRLNDWHGYDLANVGGRFYTTEPIYMRQGLKIASKDGPAVKGDEWKIQPRYDHPIGAVHHEIAPSPAKKWSSNGTAAPVSLVWDIDQNAAAFQMGGTRALYLGNVNFRQCILSGWNGSAWIEIATIDTAKQVKYHSRGNTITAHTTGVSSAQIGDTFWTYDSLAGCTFNYSNTGAPSLYKIISNSEGAFETGATKAPIVLLDGDASAESTSGDGQIWVKDISLIIPDETTKTYQKLKIDIPTTIVGEAIGNGTVSGNWEIGQIIWGHVAVFGRQYSSGHIRQIEANYELFTATGGQRRAIKRGPPRRAVEFSWVDPVDISSLADDSPSPDYLKSAGSGSRIVASVADTPFLMQGLLSRLSGSVTPVVYLPSVSTSPTAPFQVMDPNRMLYGRIVSPAHRIENQLGSEWVGSGAGEAVTATAIRIEEEI